MANNEIRYKIGYDIDKSTLNELKTQLQQLSNIGFSQVRDLNKGLNAAQIMSTMKQIQEKAKEVQDAFNKAFNTNLGTLNVVKFNEELHKIDLNALQSSLAKAGTTGQAAFKNIATAAMTTNRELKQSYSLLDSLAQTFANTIRWTVTSSAINTVTSSIQKAYSYTKNLDRSLNDIRIVTNKSAEDMTNFAEQANKAAQSLGKSTLDYTNAALIYAQQGLSDEEIAARTEVTLKAANVTQQDTAEVSEQLTAVWNGYKVSAEEAELYVDKLSAVAATTASDLEELSIGMSRVASAASLMGVDIDQLNAQLSTIISVTRQAPETVGVALRSIYARMSDIEAGLDEETTLGSYTEEMNKVGISVLDTNNKLRDMGEVIEEVGEKWTSFTREQQIFLSQAMAGTRQFNNLLALFDNWDKYSSALETSRNAMGTLQEQQDIYMESTQAHLQQLRTASQEVYSSLLDTDSINDVADALTTLVKGLDVLVDSIGGGANTLALLGSTAMRVFDQQIATGLAKVINNYRISQEELARYNAELEITNMFQGIKEQTKEFENLVTMKQKVLEFGKSVTNEQHNMANAMIRTTNTLQNQEIEWRESLSSLSEYLNRSENLSKPNFGDLSTLEAGTTKAEVVSNAFDEIDKKIEKQKESLMSGQQALRSYSREIASLRDQENRLKTTITETTKAEKEKNKQLEENANRQAVVRETLIANARALQQELNTFSKDNIASTDSVKRLEQAIRNFDEAIKGRTDPDVAIKHLISALETAIVDSEELREKYGQIFEQQVTQSPLSNITMEMQRINEEYDKFINNLRLTSQIQNVVNLVGAFGQMASSISMIHNLGNVITDENLSSSEKFLRVMTTLGMSISLLSSSFQQLGKPLLSLIAHFSTVEAETISATLATKGFGTTLWTALTPILPELLLITATIAAIGVAIYSVNKAIQAQEEALKNAKKLVTETTERYKELKQTQDDFLSSIDKYDTLVNKLKDLKEGTEEYKEAIQEANKQALELIANNQELSSFAFTDRKGLITFDKEELKEYQKIQRSLVNNANKIKIYSEQNVNNLQLENSFSKFSDILVDVASDQFFSNNELRIAFDELVQNYQDNGALLVDNTTVSEDLKSAISDNYQAINNNIKSTNNLIQSNNFLNAQIARLALEEYNPDWDNLDPNTQQSLVNALSGFEDNSIYQDLVKTNKDTASNLKTTSEIIDTLARIYLGPTFIGNFATKFSLKDILEEYAKEQGYTYSTSVFDKYGKFIDSEGKSIKVTQEILDAAIDYLSRKEGEKEFFTAESPKTQESLEKIERFGDQIAKGLVVTTDEDSFGKILQNYATTGKFDNIFLKYLSPEVIAEMQARLKEGTYDYLDGLDFSNLWVEDAEQLAKSFSEILEENYDPTEFIKLSQENAQQVQDVLSQIRADKLTKKETQELLDQMDYLIKKYPELSQIQDTTSHKFLETLRDIGEQEERNAKIGLEYRKEQLTEQLKELEDKFSDYQNKYNQVFLAAVNPQDALTQLSAKIDMDQFYEDIEEMNEVLDDIAETNRLIKVQIDLDIQSDFEGALGLVDEFQDLRDIIHDDLLYTAEEVEDLVARGYGEMFKDAIPIMEEIETANKDMNQVMIRANQETVEAFKRGQREELNAARKNKIEQLEDEVTSLKTQRNILQVKLGYLKRARLAQNAEDKAKFLTSAFYLEEEYKAAVTEMNETLNKESKTAEEKENINRQLFITLGGYYETNSKNYQQTLNDATNKQKEEVEAQLDNINVLIEAYQQLAVAAYAGMTGDVDTAMSVSGISGGTRGGTGINNTSRLKNAFSSASQFLKKGNYSYEELDSSGADILDQVQKAIEEGTFDDTINALISQTEDSLGLINDQIGELEAGIALLESADYLLDHTVGGKNKSGSSKKAKDIDELEDVFDRYHDINLIIKDLETNMKLLTDQQDKLFGKNLIDNLNTQLDLLEQQNEAYRTKINLAKEEAAELKNTLQSQGVTFFDNDYISNYMTILQTKMVAVNLLIEQYNAMSAEEQEAFKDVVDQAKKDYEKFKKNIENYDKLISETIPGLEEDIRDTLDKEMEIKIKKFTMEVELRIDMGNLEREYNKFKRKVIDGIKDDDSSKYILDNAKSLIKDYLSYFNTFDTGTGAIQKLTEQVNQTIAEIKKIDETGWSDIYNDNKSQALEDLQNYYQELMGQLEDIVDLVDEIKESYLDMIDKAIEGFDKQIDQYEYINDMLNHNINIIGLLYGDDAYSQMDKYYKKIESNNNLELDFLKKRVAYAEEMMNKETDPKAKEKWQEEWLNALKELNDKVEDALQNIIDKYANAVNKVFDKLNKKVTGGLGLDYVSEEWDLINKNADQYLDTINSMTAIQKLENKYLESINDTNSLSAQKKLNDLMEEQLSYLREKDKLTQYDVDRANMLYEIALKEIALEEAQQNKSKMRLRRDSQGNYTYQYVADDEAVAAAENDLLDARNDLYNFDKENYRENLNSIYELYEEFQQKLKELYADQTLTAEERQRKEALLVEQYGQLINGLVEENETIRTNLHQSAFEDLAMLYNTDVENFYNMSEEEQDILFNQLIPQWDSGIQHMTDKFAGDGGFIPTCSDAFESLKEITQDYQDSLDELEEAAGIDFDLIADGYDENIDKAEDLLDANDDLIDKYREEIDAILDVISELENLIDKYKEAQAAAEAATAAAYAFLQTQNSSATSGAGGSSSSRGSSASSGTGGTGSNSGSSSSGEKQSSSGGDGIPRVGDMVTYIGGKYYYDSQGTNPSGQRGPGKKVRITNIKEGAPYPIHVESTDSAYGWLRKDQISGYDTGGYTGDWNSSSGKLAVLHQKELVLNSSDTENLLSAVSLIRDMKGLFDNINNSINSRIFGLMANIGSSFAFDKDNSTLDQHVEITANFPNVQNSKEIEDAFNNLINVASQYSNYSLR